MARFQQMGNGINFMEEFGSERIQTDGDGCVCCLVCNQGVCSSENAINLLQRQMAARAQLTS